MQTRTLAAGPPAQHALVFRIGDAVGGELHGQVVCGRRDGSTVGGHLLRSVVRPTLELVGDGEPDAPAAPARPVVGLALIDPEAS